MKRALSEIAERAAQVQREQSEEAGLLEPPSRPAPTAETRRGLPLKALTAAVIVGALIPTSIFVAMLGQGTIQTANDGPGASAAEPEIALSSPERIEAKGNHSSLFSFSQADHAARAIASATSASTIGDLRRIMQRQVGFAKPETSCTFV